MKGDRNNTKVIKLKNGDYNSAILVLSVQAIGKYFNDLQIML